MSFKKEETTEKENCKNECKKEDAKDTCKCKEKHDKKCNCDDECACGCKDKNACKDNKGKSINCEKNQEEFGYLELAQRIQAEFDNYRKRTQQAEKDAKEYGIILAVEKFLPIIDSVDNAKRQVKDESFMKALDIVNNQIIQSFEALGVKRIDAVGKIFDPNLHNAIMTGTEEGKQEDEIIEEFQAGFMLNGKVIRHSVVKVNK